MKPAPIPADDERRLRSLRELRVLDTPAEGRFDRITRLTRRLFEVPIVAVSLVDESRQWFKSVLGLPVRETARDISFCGHAIHQDDMMVIDDAREDERFEDNPLVIGEPGIRFYAGQPLMGPDGAKLGTLCIIDRRPRTMDEGDRIALRDLAVMVETELSLDRLSAAEAQLRERLEDAERRSLQDSLTAMWNRRGIESILQAELSRAIREQTDLAIVLADLDHFKGINDTYGHAAGDTVLRESARRMRSALRLSDAVGRFGGEEFLFVLPGCGSSAAAVVAERIRLGVGGSPVSVDELGETLQVTLSLGIALVSRGHEVSLSRLLRAADKALYEAKSAGRDCCRIAADPELGGEPIDGADWPRAVATGGL